jgi:hypothetical protein
MAAKRNQLSKSTLIRSIQCPKSLYLYKNHYDWRDKISVSQQQIFDRGIRIGKLAQQLFPGGKDVSPPNPYSYDASIAATKALVQQQYPAIYEAAFRHHGIMAALDILVFREGKWYAYEVKSSMRISHTYLLDCAIQYHIITSSGLPLEDFRIIHINGDYVKNGDVEIDQLFTETPVLEDILGKQTYVREQIEKAVDVLSKEQIPDMPIGAHCTKPYPCDFQGYCWKNIPENSIWYLPGISMQAKSEFLEKGLTTIDELKMSDILLEKNRIVLEAYKKNQPYVEAKPLQDFFRGLTYPLYYFDLEAFQPAIPIFDGTKPFERIPFLYSVHYQENNSSALKHDSFIGPVGTDPRIAFIEHFLADTEAPGSILVFNTLMEKSILNKLAEDYPAYRVALKERIGRIVDFEIPFKNMWYYHPAMQGGFSLKTISRSILQQDPFSDSAVKDGEVAMTMYTELYYREDADQEAAVMRQLVDYCRADTLALQKIYENIKVLID